MCRGCVKTLTKIFVQKVDRLELSTSDDRHLGNGFGTPSFSASLNYFEFLHRLCPNRCAGVGRCHSTWCVAIGKLAFCLTKPHPPVRLMISETTSIATAGHCVARQVEQHRFVLSIAYRLQPGRLVVRSYLSDQAIWQAHSTRWLKTSVRKRFLLA